MREAVAPARLIELGTLRGAYGIRGWARVAPHSTDGGVLEAVREWWILRDGDTERVTVEGCRRHGAALVAKWPGMESKEAADALKGARVAVAREAFPPLPEGEHYLADVLGSRVVNRAGETLGKVSGLRANEAAGVRRQWLEVADGSATHLIPLVEQYVDEIDAAGKLVRVDWQRDW
jgi:16S rRNA processing protein RimM